MTFLNRTTAIAVSAIAVLALLVACGTRDGKPCRHPGDLEAADKAYKQARKAAALACFGGGTGRECRDARNAMEAAMQLYSKLKKMDLCEA